MPISVGFPGRRLGAGRRTRASSRYVPGSASERDGKAAVEWSWEGMDEMDPCTGRGWAVLQGDELHGMIFFHSGGDDSEFVAKRAPENKAPKRK